MTIESRWPIAVAALVVALVTIAPGFFMPPNLLIQVTMVFTFAIALAGLVVISGYGGQVVLSSGAFFAIGAYTTTLLQQKLGLHFLLTLPLGAALAFVGGLLLGLAALQRPGHLLALLTLAVAVAVPVFITQFESLSGGVRGLTVVNADPPAWLKISPSQRNYLVCLVTVALVFWATHKLVAGRIGRALMAIRDNEALAAAMGINVARHKVLAFAFSAALATLGGGLYAVVVGKITPGDFNIGFAVLLIIGLVIGGKASLVGALLGAFLVVFVPAYAGKVNPALPGVIFAVVLIAVLLLVPDGIAPSVARLARRTRSIGRNTA